MGMKGIIKIKKPTIVMDDLNMIVPRRADFCEPKLFCKSKVSIAADSIWSGRRGSNSRPQPWQGCALPTELLPQVLSQTRCFRLGLQRYAKNLYFQIFLQKNAQKMQKKSKKAQNYLKMPQIAEKNRLTNGWKFVNLS